MNRIGLDVGGTTLKLGIVDDQGTILCRDAVPSVHNADGLSHAISSILKKARALYPEAPIGISCPGVIDQDGFLSANQLCLDAAPVCRMVEDELGEKLSWENDGVCAVLAELVSGALKGCSNALMITIGTGIGGGVIVNGEVYSGFLGHHAELGHMITHADGLICSCGQQGCWEAYASATALSDMAGGLPPREVIERIRVGQMSTIWNAWLREVAQGLIGLCSIFSPEKIAIGGGLSNAGALVIDGIRNTLLSDAGFKSYHSFVEIVSAMHQNDAGILGAAAIAERSRFKK